MTTAQASLLLKIEEGSQTFQTLAKFLQTDEQEIKAILRPLIDSAVLTDTLAINSLKHDVQIETSVISAIRKEQDQQDATSEVEALLTYSHKVHKFRVQSYLAKRLKVAKTLNTGSLVTDCIS